MKNILGTEPNIYLRIIRNALPFKLIISKVYLISAMGTNHNRLYKKYKVSI